MTTHEIRDPEQARQFIAQGLWFQRVTPPAPAGVRPALRWALEVAGTGEALPPVGFVADLGDLLFDPAARVLSGHAAHVPGWPEGKARTYEDHALGKLDGDASLARASDALARYRGRDRDRALAFVLVQLARRAGLDGVHLNPAVLKAMLEAPPESILAEGWEGLARDGPAPPLLELYEQLTAALRDLGEALAPEDVFELEHGTALAAFGQRVALRQVLQAAGEFAAGVALEHPRPPSGSRAVPTRVLDEDTYPVGGFSSISNRGTIESLLHSQLAYMEPAGSGARPDLFDIKFLRGELLYYARDENQFLRRRRSFVFALFPDLVQARVKDAELPRQRIVLALGLLVAAVRVLTDWLGNDALTFEFLFVHEGAGGEPLAAERALVEMILREPIAAGTVATAAVPSLAALAEHCTRRARKSLCHALMISVAGYRLEADETAAASLRLDGHAPALWLDAEPSLAGVSTQAMEVEGPLAAWHAALRRLLPWSL